MSEQQHLAPLLNAHGFRLDRLEVYNWGTFDKRIWVMRPAGGTSLLTGENGSGKSTLVDALLTLLVPFKRRTYNLASGTEKARERDERSYILGAWGKQKDLENNRSKAQYLRQAGSHSILLAVFVNASTQQTVSLAQILWIEDSVRKLYIVAQHPLTIDEHLRLAGSPLEARKQLRTQGIEVYDEFSRYSKRFRQLVHLRSEQALDLFNQIVSIKEIGGLNEFVRTHMLERTDAQERIKQLRSNFENLTRAHDAIQQAEHQLSILEPLVQDAQKYTEQQERITEANHCAHLLPVYVAYQKRLLLVHALDEARQQRVQCEARHDALQQEIENLHEHVVHLRVAIEKDAVGQEIQLRRQEISRCEQKKQERMQQAEKYNRLAQKLELSPYTDEQTFYATRQRGLALQQRLEHHLHDLQRERDRYIQEMVRLRENYDALSQELASLQQRSSQIPAKDIAVRARMIERLHLDESAVPFVGELLRVRASEQQWEPAIERLLYNFGRRLLVAEQLYPLVSHYVDVTNLQGHLVYYRASSARAARHEGRLSPHSLCHKVEVKHDTPFTAWLTAELIDNYDYQCCETLDAFQQAHRAITLNGQVKHGQARHEKDDRYSLGDRSRYILGWNNKEKRDAISQSVAAQEKALQSVSSEIDRIEQAQRVARHKQEALQSLLEFERFATIDWREDERQLQALRQQLTELEESNTHLATLQQQLRSAEDQYKEKQEAQKQCTGDLSRLDHIITTHIEAKQRCDQVLDAEIVQQETPFLERIERDRMELQAQERMLILELTTMDTIRERLWERYQRRANSLQGQLRQLEANIINRMRDFLQTSPILAQEMDASLEALDEYRRALERIQREDLPRHRRRFKDLLNEKVITDIGSFKAALELQEDAIKASIRQLNISLGSIGYTETTYIQLNCERSHDIAIRQFRDTLRACLPDIAQARTPEANEVSFQRIRDLLRQFEQEPYWTNKVTDVRNWLDFSASELYREDGSQKNYYSDSSGKSGGQKAKLAYTILASAVAYQYGLDQKEGRANTFRFVAVDEAFSKSDERNARYAMELFRQLDLQLLVVTPLDKIHIAEPYLSACHFVVNNEDENDSKVYNLTRAEYLAQKQTWTGKEQYNGHHS